MADYVVKSGAAETGPFTTNQLREMASGGKLTASALIRKLPDGKWFRAATAKGLLPDGVELPPDPPNVDPLAHAAGKAVSATTDLAKSAGSAVGGAVRGLLKRGDPKPVEGVVVREGRFVELVKALTNEEQKPDVVEKVVERVSAILVSGEQIIFVAVQARPIVNIAPDCAVLTSQRFLFYRPKLLGRVDFEDYYWRDLADAKLQEGVLGATFSCKTAKGQVLSMDYLPKVQARRLYSIAQEFEQQAFHTRRQMELEDKRAAAGGGVVVNNAVAVAPAAGPAAAADPLAKLQQLKGMLDAGLISQAEFDAKKAEILSQM